MLIRQTLLIPARPGDHGRIATAATWRQSGQARRDHGRAEASAVAAAAYR